MLTVYRIIKIALVLFIACHVPLKAQDQRNNGYIGLGLGPSFLFGNNIKAGTGLNLTLLNAGYVLGKGFGITGTWAGGAHVFDSEAAAHGHGNPSTITAHTELSYGVLMIGPMYTLNLTDDSSLDFKAKLGSLYTREKSTSEAYAYTSENFTLGASLGVGYRKKIANRWCVMVSSDYYAARQQFSMSAGQNTHILSLTTGLGFVL
jgi:hypothetical protein